MPTHIARILSVVIAIVAGTPAPSRAQPKEGKKVAVLVGVKKYGEETGLRDLDYPEKDVADLAAVLEKQGYAVTVLTRAEAAKLDKDFLRPTAKNIGKALAGVVGMCGPEDTLLVAFSGHGAHLKVTDRLYFCPSDTDLADEKSLISIDDVMASLKSCKAGAKVLLFDACRNDPADGRTGGAPNELKSSTRPLVPDPPGGTAALFSCSKGEISHESKALGRGFLFHHVIEGLKGKAANKDGDVTWLALAKYVSDELPAAVKKERGPQVTQTPEVKGETRALVLAKVKVGNAALYELGKEDLKKGLNLYYGRGIEADVAEATKFFRNAAEAGNPEAMYYLGIAYHHQFGVNGDLKIANYWYKKAADDGHPAAVLLRWSAIVYGLREEPPTDAELDLASADLRRRADAGDPLSMRVLGGFLRSGWAGFKLSELKRDEKASVDLYQKAAVAGDPFAMAELAELLRFGREGFKKDETDAARWIEKAAKSGYPHAMTRWGSFLQTGAGVEKDEEGAIRWYVKAAKAGERTAMYFLGFAYQKGEGVEKDEKKAVEWYRKSVEAGSVLAVYSLGQMYEEGKGVAKDLDKAIEWYRYGEKRQDFACQEALKRLGVKP